MTHTIDKTKVEAELVKRGWRRGLYMEWITPSLILPHQFEDDWTAALLAGIVCEHEKKVEENKKFIDKHKTPKRSM